MSKRLGRIERAILAELKDGAVMSVIDLAIGVYDILPGEDGYSDVDNAKCSGIRRAIGSLRRKGLVVHASRRRGLMRWGTPEGAAAYREALRQAWRRMGEERAAQRGLG